MITITTEPTRKLVRAFMSGFLEVADVAHFSREKEKAVQAMGLKSGEFLLLVETAECVVQSREVVAAFQDLVVQSAYKSLRLAIVRQGSMGRMQTRRIIRIREDAAMFETCAEAEAWLFADSRIAA